MKQFLRSFLTLLMLVVWASGFAQEVTLDFTNAASDWKIPTDYQKTSTQFTNGTYTISLASNSGKGYKVQGSGVLLGEKDATLTLPAFDFDVEKIIVIKNPSGGSTKVTQNIFVGTQAASTQTKGADKDQTYSIKEAFQKAGTIYVLKVTNSNNTQFSKIEIYKKASTKTPTTLTFPKPTINIEEGNETTFTGQTATLKTGETELGNAITYTTNNDAMFEEYDAKVGPTTLKTGKYGTATVTAKFNGDDTYEASTATYTVNYTEKEKPATTLNFGFTTKTVNIDETFTAAATLKSGETAITGAVTYSSTNTKVATVDKATGEVTALTAGKAKITATFAGTSEYKSSTATYELTVVDPNATEETFDFTKPENYVHKGLPDTGDYIELEEGTQITSGIITITNVQNGNTSGYTNKPRFHNKKNEGITFRVYANGTISLSAQTGYTITKFAFEATQVGDLTVSTGTYNSATKTWEGNAQTISLTIPDGEKATWFQSMTVTYSKVATTTPLTLEEDADDTETKIKANNGKTVDVKLTRSLKAGAWNTICLPFDVTAEQIKNILKAEGMVREYADDDATAQTITFKKVEGNMKAGEPYLIKPTEDITSLAFEGVTITAIEGNIQGKAYGICGTLGKYTMKTDGTELFLNAAGKFVAPAAATNTMKGFRAYFMVPSGASAAAININIDGETTGINNIETNAAVNGKVYNLNGQYVGNSLNGLKKGIYVVNGKKVIK